VSDVREVTTELEENSLDIPVDTWWPTFFCENCLEGLAGTVAILVHRDELY
jgi:hypothetical protein